MVELHDGMVAREPAGQRLRPAACTASTARRKLAAFLAYFGAIFLTVGWWKQTDPLRSSRLRIGPILRRCSRPGLWWCLFGFPQPWGFMLVAAISITAQLSAPWLSPQERSTAR